MLLAVFFLCAAYETESGTWVKAAAIVSMGGGCLYLIADMIQYGVFFHGPAGFTIPVGVPGYSPDWGVDVPDEVPGFRYGKFRMRHNPSVKTKLHKFFFSIDFVFRQAFLMPESHENESMAEECGTDRP